MTYDIETTRMGASLFEVRVTVRDDAGEIVLEGVTHVATSDEAIAWNYAEEIFLPDLRRNDQRLADLVLPIDAEPEPEPDPDGDPVLP